MYYIGTQQFSSFDDAMNYVRANGGSITSEPVGDTTGMLTGDSGGTKGTTTKEPIKQAPLVPDDTTAQTFTFIEGSERGGAVQDYLYGQQAEPRQVTAAELEAYFSDPEQTNRLPEVFGTFDNYLAYMTEREQLLQSGGLTVGDWANADAGFNQDQEMILEGDADLTIDPSDPNQNYENLLGQQRGAQVGAYENWINSDANQALLQKYGVHATTYSGSGDKFQWNGSAYVKVQDEDHAGFTDFVKIGMMIALGAMSAGALSAAGLGTVTSSTLSSAITQAVSTGSIDPAQLLQSAATAGLTGALSDTVSNLLPEGIDLSSISTGIEEVDNVLRTMGMDVLRQGVMTGEVDLQQTLQAGVFSAAGEFIDFIQGQMGISAEEQAAWEARIASQRADQQNAMMGAIEQQFGEGALAEALNSMDAELAQMASQTLSNMFQDTGVSFVPDDTGAYVEEVVVDPTQDTTTDTDLGPINEIDYGLGPNPPEGATQLVNGVYYDENDIPIGIASNATRDQILDQFGSDTNALVNGGGSVAAHPITEDALAILVGDTVSADGTTQSLQGLSDALVGRGLVLANVNGQYVLISGSTSSTGLHSSLDQDALLNLTAPSQTFIPPPSSDPNEALLAPTNSSDISQEIQDLLTNVENAPEVPSPDWVVDAITVDPTDPIVFENDPVVTDPVNPDPIDTTDTTGGDAGTATDVGAGITIDDVTQAVNDALNQMPTGATAEEVQTAIDTAVNAIDIPAGMTSEEVQQIVNEAVGGIEIPAGMTSEQVQEIVNTAMTDVATQADVTSAVEGAVTTLQEQIAALPEGATAEEVQAAIDTAIAGIQFPESVTNQQMTDALANAIDGIQFPEGLSETDVSTIVDNALTGVATTQEMNDAINAAVEGLNQAIADIPEGMTAVEVGDIVDASIASIVFPESVTNEQMTTAISNALSGIQFPEGLTAEDVAEVVSNSGFATPENVAEAVANAGYVTPEDLGSALATAGFSTPQDVADALAAAGFSTPEDVNAAIANAGFATPEDVAAAVAAAGYSTPEDIANAVANAGYATPEDVASAIASAGYVNPEDLATALENSGFATADSLTTAQEAIDGQIAGLEASLLETLANNAQGSTDALTVAEARLLESISGVEADVLLELSQTTEGFNQAIADMDVDFREALSGGLESVQTSLMEALATQGTDQARELSAAEARLLESITGGDAATLRELSTVEDNLTQALADMGVDIGDVQTTLQGNIDALSGDVSTGFETAAQERQDLMDALAAVELGQAEALTDAQAALLAEITGGDASVLQELSTVEGALQEELGTLGTSIAGVEETLAGDIADLEAQTAEQFEQVGEDIAGSEDRLTNLFNQGLESVGGDINALATQSLDQYSSLQETLAANAEGQATALSDTEARLLENMTGVEASVLQELSAVEGGLETALGEVGTSIEDLSGDVDRRIGDVEAAMGSGFEGVADQFGQVQGELAGLGAGLEGLGTGVAGIGAGLLSGLGQLGAGQQELQQKISAPKWEDFYTGDITAGRRDFQSQYIGQPQQSNAVNNLNQLIGRSLQQSPATQGMFGQPQPQQQQQRKGLFS
jgi:hypothetical protein